MKYPDAGINPAKSGLTARAGLYFNAGLHDKGDGFNLQDLDPYLLFDAETSMLGNLENPTLDLDPATPDTLDVITATRSGIATFTSADGQIVTADPNTVRVDWSLGYPAMLIEPSATNLIQNSEDFTQDVILSNCSVQGGFTAPDGSTNAFKLTEDNTNSFKLFQAVNNTATTAGTTYTASIFVKAGERTKVRVWSYHLFNQHWWADYDLQGNILLDSGDNNGQLEGYAIEDYPDGWKRISVTGQKPVSTYSWDVGVSLLDDTGNHTYQGDGTSGVYIWGAQFEQGSVATSYIPTSGSTVTRQADNLVIDGSNFTDFYNQSEGTVYVESVGRKANAWIMSLNDATWNNRMFMFYSPRVSLQVKDNTVLQVVANSIATDDTGVLRSSSFTYKTNSVKFSCNGQTETNDTSATIPTVTRLMIGGANGSIDTYALNGHIKRLLYWPTHSDSL